MEVVDVSQTSVIVQPHDPNVDAKIHRRKMAPVTYPIIIGEEKFLNHQMAYGIQPSQPGVKTLPKRQDVVTGEVIHLIR